MHQCESRCQEVVTLTGCLGSESKGWLHWDRGEMDDGVHKMILLLNGTVDLVLEENDKAVVSHQG